MSYSNVNLCFSVLVLHLSSVSKLTILLFRSKSNALNICQKMIEMFVRTKHKIDKRHEFALVVVNDDALWVSPRLFSSPLNATVQFMCSASVLQVSYL